MNGSRKLGAAFMLLALAARGEPPRPAVHQVARPGARAAPPPLTEDFAQYQAALERYRALWAAAEEASARERSGVAGGRLAHLQAQQRLSQFWLDLRNQLLAGNAARVRYLERHKREAQAQLDRLRGDIQRASGAGARAPAAQRGRPAPRPAAQRTGPCGPNEGEVTPGHCVPFGDADQMAAGD